MAKNGRAVDPEAPFGWNKDGTPSKKRGRAPGPGTRVPGSGRKKHTMTSKSTSEYLLPLWARAMDDILSCRPFRVAGPMGKTITRIRNSDEFKHALSVVGHKCLPDQKQTQVTADVRSEVTHKEPATVRELSRAVLGVHEVLRQAKLQEMPDEPAPAPFEDPRPAPHQLLLGRDPIIDVPYSVSDASPSISQALNGGEVGVTGSTSPSFPSNTSAQSCGGASEQASPNAISGPGEGVSLAANPSHSDKPPAHGDKIHVKDNGSHIFWNETNRKWHVFDNNNTLHCLKANKAEALAKAEALPCGNHSLWQMHPFAQVTAEQINDEPRRDNQAYMPRPVQHVINTRGRKRRLG